MSDDLRAAIEALVHSDTANKYRDEATRGVAALPYASNRYVRLLDDLRAVLADHPAASVATILTQYTALLNRFVLLADEADAGGDYATAARIRAALYDPDDDEETDQ